MRCAAPPTAHDSGQAVIELALVLPVLLALVVGAFEFGRAWNEQQVITDAVREGARYCAVANADRSLTLDFVKTKVSEALGRAGIATPGNQPEVVGFQSGESCTITITIPYEFVFLGPLMRWTAGQSSIRLSSKFTMRNE
jgi:Flp pilus assembly protein TadG